jgi:cell division protein ZapA (FtsZ GTPase activity inhibitor)
MSSRSVGVRLQGRDYQIRSDADGEWLQRVAGYVDAAMNRIRDETSTVDTLDVALLTSLNLAREVIAAREGTLAPQEAEGAPSPERLRSLIERVEGAARDSGNPEAVGSFEGNEGEKTPLLTLPTGAELEEMEQELLPARDAREGADKKAGRG